jgi:hypothetical protein
MANIGTGGWWGSDGNGAGIVVAVGRGGSWCGEDGVGRRV